MNEPQAPAGARWDAPGWAETDPDDSQQVAALKAALESAEQRVDQWRQAHDRLDSENVAQTASLAAVSEQAFHLRQRLDAKQNKVFGIGFAFGFMVALALYGLLNWYGYVG